VPGFPAVSRPARVYGVVEFGPYAYHGSKLASRYVLNDDGTFALQYSSANYPFFEYRGTYREEAGLLRFEWRDSRWDATGSLTADSLTVQYNFIMEMSDFEPGVYHRIQ